MPTVAKKSPANTAAQERFTFSGTASEIARQVAIKANLPQLLHAAASVEWDDYEHSIRGKTIPEALRGSATHGLHWSRQSQRLGLPLKPPPRQPRNHPTPGTSALMTLSPRSASS